jgi:hypothetical protein
MRKLNLSNLSDFDLSERVRRFVYNNQYSLPVTIISDNQIMVMMVLEEGDFRFTIEGELIIVTD